MMFVTTHSTASTLETRRRREDAVARMMTHFAIGRFPISDDQKLMTFVFDVERRFLSEPSGQSGSGMAAQHLILTIVKNLKDPGQQVRWNPQDVT